MTKTRLCLAILAPALWLTATTPAVADTCTIQMTVTVDASHLPFVSGPQKEVTTPPVTVPCPGPADQPAPTPIWVTTDSGPGYYNLFWSWIRIKQGGRIFFANTHDEPHAYRGTGFDSGVVDPLTAREVAGVSSLAVGYYKVYDLNGDWVGNLYVDP